MTSANFFPPGSPAAHFASAVSGPYFAPLVVLYGVTALIAAVATWLMRPWMPLAFLIWSVAAVLLGTFFLVAIPTELLWGGRPAAAAFVLGMAVVLWLAYRYVRRAATTTKDFETLA